MPPTTIAERSVIERYRVERLLGTGGMGSVYAATDLELGRSVALKILAADRAADASRAQRFVREAHLASSLNHPSIATVLDAGTAEADGAPVRFLAMERVDGERLDIWAAARRGDPRKVIETMAAVADGLARAHAGGVVHRDLKPANVIVNREGQPKIVDFGIAKLIEAGDDGRPDPSDTASATVIGTAAYMSPEQVEGLPVDARSDIFSFGSVLYELLAGKPAFRKSSGEAPVETMHAILTQEAPALETLRAGLPIDVYRIVRKCLVKDRELRYQSIRDVAIDLRESLRGEEHEPPRRRRGWFWIAIAAAALIAVTVALFVLFAPRTRRQALTPAPAAPASAPTTQRITNTGTVVNGAISPDGRTIAHADREGENETLWITQVATGTRIRVVPPAPVYYVEIRFSPDGNYIYYSAAKRSNPNVTDLMQVPLLGGEPRTVVKDMEGKFAISPDGVRALFMRFDAVEREYRLTVAHLDSGEESILLTRRYPDVICGFTWTPSGRNVTLVAQTFKPDKHPGLFNLEVRTGAVTPMRTPDWPGIGPVAWLPDGSGMLVAVADRRQPPQIWFRARNGTSVRKVTSEVANYGAATVTADSNVFSSVRRESSSNLWIVDTTRPADARPLTTGLDNHFGVGGVRWLPDGRVLTTVFTPAEAWLSVVPPDGGEVQRLTRSGAAWQPAISPDGRMIAFASDRGGSPEIWTAKVDGSEWTQITTESGSSPTWTPDGKSLVFQTGGKVQAAWQVTPGGQPVQLTSAPTNIPHLSPDGKWILCRLRSKGADGPVWRTAVLPASGKGEPRYFDVPRHGGGPRLEWLPDSRSFAFVDFVDGIGNVWIQPLDGSPARQLTHFDSGDIAAYDFSRDGRKLVVARLVESNDMVVIRDFR